MAKKKTTTLETLRNKIDSEGFDYAVSGYSDWGEILDQEFHRLREAYLEAKTVFEEYVDTMEEPYEESEEE